MRRLALSLLLWGIGEGLWSFVQPIYLAYLGADETQTGLVLAASGIARLLVGLPVGWLADRIHPRHLMRVAWSAGIPITLAIGLAPDWRWALPGFALYGATGAILPALVVYMSIATPQDLTRARHLSLASAITFGFSAFALGTVVGPALGGVIGDRLGLRPVFAFSAVWFGLSTLVMLRLPISPRRGPDEVHTPTLTVGLLRFGSLWLPFVLFGALFLATSIGFPLAARFLADERGFSLSLIGLFGSINALGATFLNARLGKLPPWQGLGIAVAATGLAYSLLLTSGATWLVGLAYFMLGVLPLTRALALGYIGERVSAARRGSALGLVDMISALTIYSLAPGLAGLLYATSAGLPFLVSLALAPVVLIGVLVWLRPAAPRRLAEAVQPTAQMSD